MKALFMKAALLAVLGVITLSAGAAPKGKTAGTAQTVIAVIQDIPISAAKP